MAASQRWGRGPRMEEARASHSLPTMAPGISESEKAPLFPPSSLAKSHRGAPTGPSLLFRPHTHGDVDRTLWSAHVAEPGHGQRAPAGGSSPARPSVLCGPRLVCHGARSCQARAGGEDMHLPDFKVSSENPPTGCSSVSRSGRPQCQEATGPPRLRIRSLSVGTAAPLSSSPPSCLSRDATHGPGMESTPLVTPCVRGLRENQRPLCQPNRELAPSTERTLAHSPGESFIS